MRDQLWNFTRKLVTGNLKKQWNSFDVNTDTIDNYCKDNDIDCIDILKIDTEGSEIEVLEGAKNMLNKIERLYYVKFLSHCTNTTSISNI